MYPILFCAASSDVHDGNHILTYWLSWNQLCSSFGAIIWSSAGCHWYIHTDCDTQYVHDNITTTELLLYSDYVQEGCYNGAVIFTLHKAFYFSVSACACPLIVL